jgi:hypothetical protein
MRCKLIFFYGLRREKKAIAFCRLVGNIMTMNYLRLPNPNDPEDIERHKQAVLEKFSAMFALTDSALQDSIPKANNIFALFGGGADRAVHAMNTRYLMKVFLSQNAVAAEEKTFDDLNIEWVPNCGLYIKQPEAEFRILKTGPWGVPKATSEARSRYYSSNQLLLGLSRNNSEESDSDLPITLVLLWDINDQYGYLGLEIACPRNTKKDGTVDCYWITRWNGSASAASPVETPPQAPDTDLEGITRIPQDKSRAAKG